MKQRVDDLALLGGSPAFERPLHVGRPNLGDRQRLLDRINDLLDRVWLSNDGPYLAEFERRVADIVGVKHCVATCNGTVALEILIRAVGLSGEVIVPSFTFVATAHALQWLGVRPVFADVDPRTHTLDPIAVERAISPRTTGIIGVHLWGQACDIEGLSAVARRHDLTLLFDAAHAFGCSYRRQMVGNFGAAEVFSFHATKFCNAFEGGAVVTNDDTLAERVRLMRSFGFADYDTVLDVGTNGKMSEAAAAMGITSLESIDAFVSTNYRNYARYRDALADLPGVRLLPYDERDQHNYQYVVLEIEEAVAGVSRDQVQAVLWAENVFARRYFYPGCHHHEPYRSSLPQGAPPLPVTERLAREVLCLPTGTAIGAHEIDGICGILRLVIAYGAEVATRLLSATPARVTVR